MLSKQDIIYNIPENVQSLYNQYINLARFHLSYEFLLLIDYNNVQNLINQFNTHDVVIAMKNEYNNKVLNYKTELKNLNGKLYTDIPEIREIKIDNITGLWMSDRITNSNILQYYLPINGKLIESRDLFFDVDNDKTEQINQLGLLNKFQYDILHKRDNNCYLNYLKLCMQINPLNLYSKYLKDNMLRIIKDLSFNDLDVIKRYWLLSEFTKKDQYDIENIFADKLLSQI